MFFKDFENITFGSDYTKIHFLMTGWSWIPPPKERHCFQQCMPLVVRSRLVSEACNEDALIQVQVHLFWSSSHLGTFPFTHCPHTRPSLVLVLVCQSRALFSGHIQVFYKAWAVFSCTFYLNPLTIGHSDDQQPTGFDHEMGGKESHCSHMVPMGTLLRFWVPIFSI